MNYHKTIEKIAGHRLTEEQVAKFTNDQWGLVCSYLRNNDYEDTGAFKITSVAREDLESIGYDTSKVDDGTMLHLASKMANAYCDNGFWIDLPILAEDLEIPKKK